KPSGSPKLSSLSSSIIKPGGRFFIFHTLVYLVLGGGGTHSPFLNISFSPVLGLIAIVPSRGFLGVSIIFFFSSPPIRVLTFTPMGFSAMTCFFLFGHCFGSSNSCA